MAGGGTRICVKGLPRHADEARLRSHFANIGGGRSTSTGKIIITDAKVVRTPDGRSRQFGFVGFRNHADAARAIEYFDRSFMGAARLSVEWASGVGGVGGGGSGGGEVNDDGSPSTPAQARPWSKYTKAKLAADAAAAAAVAARGEKEELPPPPPAALKGKGGGSKAGAPAAASASSSLKAEDDPRFAEFLQLMAPRSAVPLWANDDATAAAGGCPATPATPCSAKDAAEKKEKDDNEGAEESDDDDDLYEELPAARGAKAKKKDKTRKKKSTSDDDGDDEEEEEEVKPLSDPAVADAAVSDLDYLKRRVVSEISDDEEEEERDEDEEESDGDESDEDDDEEEAEEAEEQDNDDDEDEASLLPPPPPLPPHSDSAAAAPAAALAACRGRLFLRNLPFTATEDDVRELFEQHRSEDEGGRNALPWKVESVHVVLDRVSRQSRGIALVQLSGRGGSGGDAAAAAEAALRALDGTIFQGRLLHVLPARPAPSEDKGGEGDADSSIKNSPSFKAAREAARRAGAGGASDARAWNALFMRQDTVAAAVAAHYGVSKADLLSSESTNGLEGDSPAVRMALGEAHVIAATKAALATAGVDVAKLEASAAAAGAGNKNDSSNSPPSSTLSPPRPIKRSSTALVIKNLPYSTTERELRSLLAPFGPLKRLVLPPTKTVAVCEFGAPPDARAALRGLAYRRLRHVPLYLEWAPDGAFVEGAPTLMDRKGEGDGEAAAAVGDDSSLSSSKKQRKADAVAAAAEAASASAAGEATAATASVSAAPSAATRTLFVKNLSFATDDDGLRRHFELLLRSPAMSKKLPSSSPSSVLRSARVARKKPPPTKASAPPSSKQPAPLLSAGYGFVELESEEAAAAVLALFNGRRGAGGKAPPLPRLDGHALIVEPATATVSYSSASVSKSKKDDTRTKLAVLNLAFQATRSDLVSLFSPFGAVRSCRVPKRAAASLDGSHRGYAFVDFASHGEAVSALDGLSGTHLYGRRLALQWAEEDAPDASAPGGMEVLTAKAAKRSRAAGFDGGGENGGGGGRSIKQRLRGVGDFDIE